MNFNPSVRGPDISFYQDNPNTPARVDFQKMRAAGSSFVILRAGQNKWVDPIFSYNLIEAKKAGLPVGAYFFYDSRVTPEEQADLFLSLVRGMNLELGIWLDLEENYNGAYRGWQNWKKCLGRLRANAPFVGVYTAPAYWIRNRPTGSADLAYFKEFPLWIANYDVPEPLIPGPWEYAILWQMGTPAIGLEYGVESLEIDMNYWNGSPESFRAYWGLGTSQPPTTEPGEVMANTWYRVTASVLNIRSGPGTSYSDVGDLLLGDVIEVTENIGGWLHIVSIHRGGVRIPEPALAWCKDSYTVLTSPPVVTPPPPPAETDSVFVDIEADVTATFNGRQYHGVIAFGNVELKAVE